MKSLGLPVLALFLAISLWTPASALACSCIEPPPPLVALDQADAVFSGRTLTAYQIPGTNDYVYTVRVLAVWKGSGEPFVTIHTSDPAMCGIWLNPGMEYLVYAYELDGSLESDNCTRTKMLEFAAEDLAELGEPNIVVAKDQPSWGMIKLRYE